MQKHSNQRIYNTEKNKIIKVMNKQKKKQIRFSFSKSYEETLDRKAARKFTASKTLID